MPPVNPLPPPPPLPSDWQKRLPFYISAVSVAVAGIGTYVQTTLLPNSDFLAMFPYAANIPGICAIVVGFCGSLLASPFFATSNAKKLEAVIDHKDTVIDHKDAIISETKQAVEKTAALVDQAAATPALVPPGVNPIKFRLKLALSEAVDADDDEMVDGIRLLMRKKGGGT